MPDRRKKTVRERTPEVDPFSSAVFTVEAEYALRIMATLAGQGARALSPLEIAGSTLIPCRALDRVLLKLKQQGLVRKGRGSSGGYTLARAALEIRVLEVIRALQPLERIRSCPLGKPEHCGGLCSLHRRLDDSIASIIKIFGGVSLQQLVNEPLRPTSGGNAEPER